ncbi:MAG: hypothetical protein WB798_12490 [Nocardioidaceae bacterium]
MISADSRVRLTGAGRRTIAHLRQQLNGLRTSDLGIEAVKAEADRIAGEFAQVLRTEVTPVGRPTSSSTADPASAAGTGTASPAGDAAPAAESTDSPTATATASPTGSPTGSPAVTGAATDPATDTSTATPTTTAPTP